MARKAPQPIEITSSIPNNTSDADTNPLSALSLKSPKSPRSPFRFSSKSITQTFSDPSMQAPGRQETRRTQAPISPTESSQQSQISNSASQQEPHEKNRPPTLPPPGAHLGNYIASKPTSRLQSSDTIRPVRSDTVQDGENPTTLEPGTTPRADRRDSDRSRDKSVTRRPVGGVPSKSDSAPADSNPTEQIPQGSSGTKKAKPKPFSLLNRTRSIRNDRDGGSPNDTVQMTISEPERAQTFQGMRTAPLRREQDRSFKDIMASNSRNRSVDRHASGQRNNTPPGDAREDSRYSSQPSSYRENAAPSFLQGLMKNGGSKAFSVGKGLLNKVGRSYSSTEKELPVDDEHYQIKVINQPLIEQTRLTRISKRLEDSRDKTEFWMPSFPWRAIDYLNYRGTETEGLYRVPGSGPQIKKWQRRFDEELDIDLFEQEDLYDINIIGSMLKAWLRELPDELFPKDAQDRISRKCASSGTDEVPQLLIDELSNLKPYNYYLLFAITCHLSLLLAHSDKNKMDFRNLCICFQPCMKLDAYCFKFLVVDWAQCWKGCKTEQLWLEKEYDIFDMAPPSSGEGQSNTAVESHDERNVSSSDSSKPSSVSIENSRHDSKPSTTMDSSRLQSKSKPQPLTRSNISHTNMSVASTETTTSQDHLRTPKKSTPEFGGLAPIAPLSPMNF